MNGVRPIGCHELVGIADLGGASAGLLVKLDGEGPGRSWFALLPSGAHAPVDLRPLDLREAESVRPDCPRCFGTAMSLPYDSASRTCEGCGGWRWMGNPMIWSEDQERKMRREQRLPGQARWLRERWAHIRRLRGEAR